MVRFSYQVVSKNSQTMDGSRLQCLIIKPAALRNIRIIVQISTQNLSKFVTVWHQQL